MKVILIVLIVLFQCEGHSQRDLGVSKDYVLDKINTLRTKGCRCGKKRFKAVPALGWNSKLETSAYKQAKQMDQYNYFAHISIEGYDIGDKLERVGYQWQYAGENLAEGQDSFDEAFNDWKKSKTHCEMLMNPNMKQIGVARYGKYWVQHFGALMPPQTKRTKIRYREGE